MHCGLYTCYVQELVAEAATKAVWKALHLVLLKDDKGLLPVQLWDIQWENSAANLDQCLVLLDYLQGLIFVSWFEHTKVYLRLQIWSTKGNSDNTTLERTLELAIVDFGFWYWPIFCGNPVLLHWKTALKSEWGPISMLISADMVRMVAREKG